MANGFFLKKSKMFYFFIIYSKRIYFFCIFAAENELNIN